MFEGWFSARCPVDDAAKAWIEDRLVWLCQQFGRDVFTRRAVILPTGDFFPVRVMDRAESVRSLLDCVCGYMDVEPEAVTLKLVKQDANLWLVNEAGKYLPTSYAGLYEEGSKGTVIHIDSAGLGNLEGLIGTMAHELAHLRLMGERRVAGDEFDNELLTDLTVVFHGLGIFGGNLPRNWDGQYTKWPGTTLNRPEYMTLPMYGYALAHAAWLRRERKPAWAKYMSVSLRASFKQGVRYLFETGDTAVPRS